MNFFKVMIGSIKHWANEQLNTLKTEIKHDLEDLQAKVGDTPVSDQINDAVSSIEVPEHTWESLPDKPFGDGEETQTVLFDDYVEVETVTEGSQNSVSIYFDSPMTLMEDKEITVVVDGESETATIGGEYFGGYVRWMARFASGRIASFGDIDNVEVNSMSLWLYDTVTEPTTLEIQVHTLESPIYTIDEKYIPDTIARVSDIPEVPEHIWESLPDKPFGEELGTATLLPERDIVIAARDSAHISFEESLVLGETYTITVDGVSYEIECTYNDTYGEWYQLIVNDDFDIYQDVGQPYLYFNNYLMDSVTYVVSIVGPGKVVKTLDSKFIGDDIARTSDVITNDNLTDAVESALTEAKESGEFDGAPGKTPEKGIDYYTDADKTEMVNSVLAALPTWTGGSY